MLNTILKKKPCGLFNAAWLFLFFFLLPMPAASGAKGNPYLESLIREADSRRLYEKREWQALLHYKHTTFHGFKSLIDDPNFFNSKDGNYDPKSELEETLKGFFRTDIKDDQHPQCRSVARYEWLKEGLNIDENRLPHEDCKALNELMEAVKPESIVLVFPVAHMNSPASMFGHTLLRIDSATESKLISYAVNYAAFTMDDNGLVFGFKGIFGYYRGYYTILPYYEKIKEYNNLDNRDMWEYRLNFSKEEVRRLVLHVWELKDIYSHYYFFDENCSYNLLMLLEAARPDADLTESLPPWVIPMDTVRDVQGHSMYSKEVNYRPSRATKIRLAEGITQAGYRGIAQDIAEGETDPEGAFDNAAVSSDEKVRTLDLAAEYLQYMYSKKKVDKEHYLKLYMRILSARSKLGKGVDYRIKTPDPPEAGHGSARLSLGVGSKRGDVYQYVRLRPSNHDLMDPDTGYLPGAAISFLDTELRYTYPEGKLSLERLTLVEVTSISNMGGFFKPVSWEVKSGLAREEFLRMEERTVYETKGGPGVAFAVFGDGQAYGFLEPGVKFGDGLKKGYSFGWGGTIGILKPLTDAWKVQLQIKVVSFDFGDRHRIYGAELNQRFTINRSNAVKLDFKREKFSGFYSSDLNLSWNIYF